jgi:gas vesicle protein
MASKNLMVGTLIGSIVGLTAALLLAPKSGADLMRDLSSTLTRRRARYASSHYPHLSKYKKASSSYSAHSDESAAMRERPSKSHSYAANPKTKRSTRYRKHYE